MASFLFGRERTGDAGSMDSFHTRRIERFSSDWVDKSEVVNGRLYLTRSTLLRQKFVTALPLVVQSFLNMSWRSGQQTDNT